MYVVSAPPFPPQSGTGFMPEPRYPLGPSQHTSAAGYGMTVSPTSSSPATSSYSRSATSGMYGYDMQGGGHPVTPIQQAAPVQQHPQHHQTSPITQQQLSPLQHQTHGFPPPQPPQQQLGSSPPMMPNAAFQFPSMVHDIRVSPDALGQVPTRGLKPRATTTLWEDEGTLCFQVEAKGICVARRTDNNMINGTKLLNVAGLTRGRRDGILKSEKVRHVVKIGTMFLKGVWIPYERALEFAAREKIVDILYPLFVADIRAFLYHPVNYTRTLQVLAAAQRKKVVDQQMQLQVQQEQQISPLARDPHQQQQLQQQQQQQQQQHALWGYSAPGNSNASLYPPPPPPLGIPRSGSYGEAVSSPALRNPMYSTESPRSSTSGPSGSYGIGSQNDIPPLLRQPASYQVVSQQNVQELLPPPSASMWQSSSNQPVGHLSPPGADSRRELPSPVKQPQSSEPPTPPKEAMMSQHASSVQQSVQQQQPPTPQAQQQSSVSSPVPLAE